MTQLDQRIEKIRHRIGYGWSHDELLLLMEAEIKRLRLLLRRHQVASCDEDSDLAVETRAAIGAEQEHTR